MVKLHKRHCSQKRFSLCATTNFYVILSCSFYMLYGSNIGNKGPNHKIRILKIDTGFQIPEAR